MQSLRRAALSEAKKGVATVLAALMVFAGVLSPVAAVAQEVVQTPVTPMELPVEVEIEVSPAGSLKQVPLWKELYQLLKHPGALDCTPDPARPNTCLATNPVERRPGFGVTMPTLRVWSPGYNFLTAEPLWIRTADGETSWDKPGPLFDPEEVVPVDAFNTPTTTRTVIGALVQRIDGVDGFENDDCPPPAGCLVVSNPGANDDIPEDGTIVGVPAVKNGVLQELVGTSTTATEDIEELEIPINEEDFFRPGDDTADVPPALQPYIGRLGAEVLGKALFWDMQIGSDGVQSCGSCHFHAGVDSRTKNQRNPNVLGPDGNNATLEALDGSNTTAFNSKVVAADFPFHKRVNANVTGDGTNPAIVTSDSNDVLSSMGVSRFKQFVDIPTPGTSAFGSAVSGVRPLLRDIGNVAPDPVPVNNGLRRVEPRNTPTMHAAAFNLDNFWDGRARFNFNGGSVFGPSDPTAHIFIDDGGELEGATNGELRDELEEENPVMAAQPVRIKFSSLASQAVGPPLSDFEMSFAGRNWAKIGKKLLQGALTTTTLSDNVTPLANQLVDVTDSRLGPFSNQGGALCSAVPALYRSMAASTAPGRPGLCISYAGLIGLAFAREYWQNLSQHLVGTPDPSDPFDGYSLTIVDAPCTSSSCRRDTNRFNQVEANFSLFFGLAVQAYEELLIPDDTPFDRFMDANPFAGNGIGQPGEQAVLFPTIIPDLVDDGMLNLSSGNVTLIPDDPSTPEFDGFGPDELFGFDIFAGGNLTAALPVGSPRNPAGFGSNPFTRNARCMLCHLGPEQTDHSINISHGLLKGDAEFEFPTPPSTGLFFTGPGGVTVEIASPEPPGTLATVGGLILAEEVEESPQDAVEVEPRGFALLDDPATSWDDRIVAQPSFFAFGDQGIYNVGLRPNVEDVGRGGDDPFGWPLSSSALTLINIAGDGNGAPATPANKFEPCNGPLDDCVIGNVDPDDLEDTFEESGDELLFPNSAHGLESVNPGFERSPTVPLLPEYMAPWINGVPAGEAHPLIDEMAGFAPNILTPPNGGPGIEFTEVLFGDDVHCGTYDPANFGAGAPNYGWGPLCPNNSSGVGGNFEYPIHGTWPVPNRVLRDGAFKAPQLRNVELTGPYFHTGSYLTLRQVVKFYLRGGDFPLTNADNRDPHIVDVSEQAFGFGRTTEVNGDLGDINHTFSTDPPFTLVGNIGDALADGVYRYDAMPDTNHLLTPEPASTTQEQAEVALVKLLISFTDPRVRYERAPFDRPELFVPIDGRAPDNTGGRSQLLSQSTLLGSLGTCVFFSEFPNVDPCFRRIPAVGAAGNPTPLPSFLGISSTPVPGPNNDHFDP